ncbi:MAG: hypothetical protein QOG95_5140, partial [Mycobacterium sp.]|nr:hypothetical protein [Mycobacterium sp.]
RKHGGAARSDVQCTDGADLPFEDNSYDAVISCLARARRRIRWEPTYRDSSTDLLSLGGVLPQFAPGVDLSEELLDRDGRVCRAGRAEYVECVLSAGQFGVGHRLGARFA